MRQVKFEQLNSELWQQLERVLDDLDLSKRKRQLAGGEHERLPELYRKTCNHYALAQSRHYSPALEGAQLHSLVLRGHSRLYRRRGAGLWRLLSFIGAEFPRTLRQNARYFWLATALFLLPAMLVDGYCYTIPR